MIHFTKKRRWTRRMFSTGLNDTMELTTLALLPREYRETNVSFGNDFESVEKSHKVNR